VKRDVDFLYEIGALRHQPRMWHRFFGAKVASISEHHFRVIWLALIIAAREKKGNTEKIIKMALVHDIPESRTGDADYMSRQYVTRKEGDALAHMLDKTSIKQDFLSMWNQFEKRRSIEAKIVKDADNLDVDIELREQGAKGSQLEEDWRETRGMLARSRFYTESAKQLYDEIAASNPSDWHVNSPYNRLRAGDWKKK